MATNLKLKSLASVGQGKPRRPAGSGSRPKASGKKILYVITKSNFGGAQRYVYDLACAFEREYKVVVALGGDGLLKQKLCEKGIRTRSTAFLQRDVNIFKEIAVIFYLWRLVQQEAPAILHVNSSKAGGLGAFVARVYNLFHNKKIHTVFTVHGWAYGEDRPLWQRMVIGFFSWLTAFLAHAVITVSDYDKQKASWMPCIQKKLTTVHNGIAQGELFTRGGAQEMLRKHVSRLKNKEEKEDVVWIGTISELHRNKGLLYLLDAVDRLRKEALSFVVVIIGEGEERAHLEERIEELGLQDYVFLAGFLEDAAVYLSAFDIFTLTSHKEGLPYTLLEAGYAGCAVLATGVGGIPEIITHGESGVLIESKSHDAIYRALRELIHDAGLREVYGRRLCEKVEKAFSLSHMVEKTRGIYEEIL